MANAKHFRGTVLRGSTTNLKGYFDNKSGVALTQAAVSSIAYTICLLDEDYPEDPDTRTADTGHVAVALDKTSVI